MPSGRRFRRLLGVQHHWIRHNGHPATDFDQVLLLPRGITTPPEVRLVDPAPIDAPSTGSSASGHSGV